MIRTSIANRQIPLNGYALIALLAERAAVPDRVRGDKLQNAGEQRDPPQGVQVAQRDAAAGLKELRVADRRDAPDHIQDAAEGDHDRRELGPALGRLIAVMANAPPG
jgi:hypothetical protein